MPNSVYSSSVIILKVICKNKRTKTNHSHICCQNPAVRRYLVNRNAKINASDLFYKLYTEKNNLWLLLVIVSESEVNVG